MGGKLCDSNVCFCFNCLVVVTHKCHRVLKYDVQKYTQWEVVSDHAKIPVNKIGGQYSNLLHLHSLLFDHRKDIFSHFSSLFVNLDPLQFTSTMATT